jgi:hypothetical protein
MVFVFASINVLYYIYRFVYVEPPLDPWDEADLVVVNDLSDTLLDSVCHYFVEDVCIDVHLGDWSTVLFGDVFVWFCIEYSVVEVVFIQCPEYLTPYPSCF